MSNPNSLQRYLEARHIPFEVVAHPHSATSLQSAKSAHIRADQLAKAVILESDDCFLAAVIPADRHVMIGRLRQTLGRDLWLAGETSFGGMFPDCEPGAVPPLTQPYGMDMVWDDSLMSMDSIYMEAGDHEHLLRIRTRDLAPVMEQVPHCQFSSPI